MTPDIALQLGDQLRQLRLQQNLSQEEAAHLAGYSRERWSQLERGKCSHVGLLSEAARAIGAHLVCYVEMQRF
jgi:transcriptional regulator with XRE-family HTH domain